MRTIFLSAVLALTTFSYGQEYFLVTGTYTGNNAEGIYVYRFNAGTGELSPVDTVNTDNPSYLAVSKDNRYIYAVNENAGGNSGVSAFSFDATSGALTLINRQSSQGDHPCYVAVDASSQWVVAGNYTGGNFSVYPIAGDGGIGRATQVIQHTGGSVHPERQEKPHVHCTVFAPDRKHLVVCDLGKDKILTYPFNARKNPPLVNKGSETSVNAGEGPRHIVFHPAKGYAYVIGELSGTVTAYRYKDGQFAQLHTVSTHPEGYSGDIGSAAIRISGDGKFLYASNRGNSNTIAIFSIDEATGRLTSKGFVNTGGEAPRDFVIDPTDSFLLCGNAQSNEIRVFRRDKGTGLLEDTGRRIEVRQPVSMIFIPVKAKKN